MNAEYKQKVPPICVSYVEHKQELFWLLPIAHCILSYVSVWTYLRTQNSKCKSLWKPSPYFAFEIVPHFKINTTSHYVVYVYTQTLKLSRFQNRFEERELRHSMRYPKQPLYELHCFLRDCDQHAPTVWPVTCQRPLVDKLL